MMPAELIGHWLERQLPSESLLWLTERREELRSSYTDRALHITLGLIPRRLGKGDLELDAADLGNADEARRGWNPSGWSVADAARVMVLVEAGHAGNRAFAERFTDLCRTADVGESIALYRGLALYPDPETLERQAAEGLRTNMRAVFEAVAHRSPYPREQFDTARWNQMVLKALFVESTLYPIQGLDDRANEALARMLCDYAHERWAAGRPVAPELWRCVGPFAEGGMVDDLARALAGTTDLERQAAALALAACPAPEARRVLDGAGGLARRVERGELSWKNLYSDPS